MLGDVRRRFRSGAELTPQDRKFLYDIIVGSDDHDVLCEAIYFFGYSFPRDTTIHPRCCDLILEDRHDELTAVCIKALYVFGASDYPDLTTTILERIYGSHFDERIEQNRAVRLAFKMGSFSSYSKELTDHFDKFNAWNKAQEQIDFYI